MSINQHNQPKHHEYQQLITNEYETKNSFVLQTLTTCVLCLRSIAAYNSNSYSSCPHVAYLLNVLHSIFEFPQKNVTVFVLIESIIFRRYSHNLEKRRVREHSNLPVTNGFFHRIFNLYWFIN